MASQVSCRMAPFFALTGSLAVTLVWAQCVGRGPANERTFGLYLGLHVPAPCLRCNVLNSVLPEARLGTETAQGLLSKTRDFRPAAARPATYTSLSTSPPTRNHNYGVHRRPKSQKHALNRNTSMLTLRPSHPCGAPTALAAQRTLNSLPLFGFLGYYTRWTQHVNQRVCANHYGEHPTSRLPMTFP
jgi:hypothetical protein